MPPSISTSPAPRPPPCECLQLPAAAPSARRAIPIHPAREPAYSNLRLASNRPASRAGRTRELRRRSVLPYRDAQSGQRLPNDRLTRARSVARAPAAEAVWRVVDQHAYVVSGVRCQVSGVRLSGVRLSGVRCQVSGLWSLVSGLWSLVSGLRFQT